MKTTNFFTLSLLVCSSLVAQEQSEESNKTVVTIRSTVVVDNENLDKFLEEVKDDCQTTTRKYAQGKGVRSVETTVENEDSVRCEECAGGLAGNEDDQEVNKCNCGKPKPKSCSSCSSCCSSCKPSCCKSEEASDEQESKSCSSCCKPSCSSCCKSEEASDEQESKSCSSCCKPSCSSCCKPSSCCKSETIRCEECAGGLTGNEDDQEINKCNCGKPKPKSCSSCSSCCSSCKPSCCKS